jgi:hypothetical protein
MAVILRSPGVQASALRRAFSQVGIPVASELQALAGNPAITPFLLLARVAIGAQPLNLDTAERLLLSEFGGLYFLAPYSQSNDYRSPRR